MTIRVKRDETSFLLGQSWKVCELTTIQSQVRKAKISVGPPLAVVDFYHPGHELVCTGIWVGRAGEERMGWVSRYARLHIRMCMHVWVHDSMRMRTRGTPTLTHMHHVLITCTLHVHKHINYQLRAGYTAQD